MFDVMKPNKADVVNPVKVLRFAGDAQWGRVTDLGRWAVTRIL